LNLNSLAINEAISQTWKSAMINGRLTVNNTMLGSMFEKKKTHLFNFNFFLQSKCYASISQMMAQAVTRKNLP